MPSGRRRVTVALVLLTSSREVSGRTWCRRTDRKRHFDPT